MFMILNTKLYMRSLIIIISWRNDFIYYRWVALLDIVLILLSCLFLWINSFIVAEVADICTLYLFLYHVFI